jgi:hypothetical protein
MAYNANIPQATDLLSTSQGQILGNFTQLNTAWLINHVDFNAGNAGKHKWVTFPSQAAIPPTGSGFLAGEIGAYNAVNPTTNINELYLNKQSFAGTVQVASTASIMSTSTPPQYGSGWTYLPSGILMKWGVGTVPANTGTFMLTFPAGPPAFNQVFNGQVTLFFGSGSDANKAIQLYALTTTQIWVYASQRITTGPATANTNFQYLVIGY